MAKAKSDEPELEIKAKLSGSDKFKEWGKHKGKHNKGGSKDGGGGMVYFVGFVGALIYWMQAASGFGAVLTGILKAFVWPAYVVYQLLTSFYGVV